MDEVGPEGASDAASLSPGEIAYHDFARAPDGLHEDEVRAFLGRVADVIAAARERELGLEERVVELEAQLEEARRAVSSGPSGSANPPDPRARALFARLREEGDASAAEPEPVKPTPEQKTALAKEPATEAPLDAEATDADAAASEGVDEAEPAPEPEPTPDDGIRARRDELLEPLTADLVRAAKRLLQDEQNLLLDAARRARARLEPDRLLPELEQHRDTWAALLTPALDAAYSGGRGEVVRSHKSVSAPERVRNDLAAELVAPLRERLATTLASVAAQGPYESSAELHRELASAVGARYREWRAADLGVRLGDTLAAAYARGAYDAAPAGAHLRWVTDAGQRCPDCEDNSLEPTVKGHSFPTGQHHPPAHPGCRCIVVVVEPDHSDRATRN